MPPTTQFNIYNIKQEILNKLRANLNAYDLNTRVTERTTTFTGDGSTTKFLLSDYNLSYVKSVTIASVTKEYITDWDISWRGTDKGKIILTSAPALSASIVVVWGEKNNNGQFIYSDFPKSNLGKYSYPRIGFKFTSTSRAGGMGGSTSNVLVNEGLLQIKIVDLDTFEVDYLASLVCNYIKQNCKNFYYFNYIEPRTFAEYDNYGDNTEQTFSKIIEFVIPAKYEIINYV